MTKPQGVIAILTAPTGHVMAHAADFTRGGAAGCTEQERQEVRARDALKHAAIRAMCSDYIGDSISTYVAGQVLNELCKKGFSITVIPIGYEDDDE